MKSYKFVNNQGMRFSFRTIPILLFFVLLFFLPQKAELCDFAEGDFTVTLYSYETPDFEHTLCGSMVLFTLTKEEFFDNKDNLNYFSMSIESEEMDAESLLNAVGALIKFEQSLESLQIYYAYSEKLGEAVVIDGQRVNLQIAVRDGKLIAGSPLIAGSY